jgi:hypothetical protein
MRGAAVVLLAAACAHEQPRPLDLSKLPPLPRSSIAAVIEQRDALGLTGDQVQRLSELDDQRARVDQEIRSKAGEAKPTSSTTQQQSAAAGSGQRGAGSGHMGRGRRGSGFTHREAGDGSASAPRSLQDRLDDIDTDSYLDAEQSVLTPAQRPAARLIAEDFREHLYERRELLRHSSAGH